MKNSQSSDIAPGEKTPNNADFERIYLRHFSGMLNFTYAYVMDRAVAEDIVHDVFLTLWNNFTELSDLDTIHKYIFKLLRNACLNHLRRLKIQDKHNDKLIEALLFSETYDYLEDADLKGKVAGLLGSLSEKQREALNLKYFEDLKYSEIANRMAISETTVRTHLKRAMQALKETMPFVFYLFLIN